MALSVVVLMAAGLGAGLGVAFGGGSNQGANQTGGATPSTELASLQKGCQQWLEANPTEQGTAEWCSDMTGWMSDYMSRSGMDSQQMWGDPEELAATCQRWMATSPPAGLTTSAQSWCSSMVAWMTDNVDSWTGRPGWGAWMREGPMGGCCRGRMGR